MANAITIEDLRQFVATVVFLFFVTIISVLAPKKYIPVLALITLSATLLVAVFTPSKILTVTTPIMKVVWIAMAVYGLVVSIVALIFPAMLYTVAPFQMVSASTIIGTTISLSAFLGFLAALYREGEEVWESAEAGAVIGILIGLASILTSTFSGLTTLDDLGQTIASMMGISVAPVFLPFLGLFGLMFFALISAFAAATIGEFIY